MFDVDVCLSVLIKLKTASSHSKSCPRSYPLLNLVLKTKSDYQDDQDDQGNQDDQDDSDDQEDQDDQDDQDKDKNLEGDKN